MKNKIVWCILSMMLLFTFCDIRPESDKKADQDADRLYTQICEVVESGNSTTAQWRRIRDNCRQGKRILFMTTNDAFSIVIIRNNGEYSTPDSTQPLDTSAVMSDPAFNSLEAAMAKTQAIANRLSGGK